MKCTMTFTANEIEAIVNGTREIMDLFPVPESVLTDVTEALKKFKGSPETQVDEFKWGRCVSCKNMRGDVTSDVEIYEEAIVDFSDRAVRSARAAAPLVGHVVGFFSGLTVLGAGLKSKLQEIWGGFHKTWGDNEEEKEAEKKAKEEEEKKRAEEEDKLKLSRLKRDLVYAQKIHNGNVQAFGPKSVHALKSKETLIKAQREYTQFRLEMKKKYGDK